VVDFSTHCLRLVLLRPIDNDAIVFSIVMDASVVDFRHDRKKENYIEPEEGKDLWRFQKPSQETV
jgi:hypothetical protein